MAGSSNDKEGEAVACELGIKYPTLQAIYAGKLNKESIQGISTYDIIYNIICSYMISLLISHMFQVQGKKTYAGQTASAAYHNFTGNECLDVHLLKPAHVDTLPWQPNLLCNNDDVHQPAWLEYPFRRVHQILRWSTVHCACGWCPSLRLKESGVSVSARAGSGQMSRGSGAANRPGLGLPAAVQNEQTVYDIIYDINVFMISR